MFLELLFLIALIVGLVDLVLFIQISNALGIYVIVITQLAGAAFGGYKVRRMDFNLYFFLDAELKKGQSIIREIWEEAFLLTGFCLLTMPGFISDIIGIACLIPNLRNVFIDWID